MGRVIFALSAVVLGVALVAGTGTSGDVKKPPKGQLPAGWKKLDLSKEQVLKIYSVQGKYKAKIKGLKDQIAAMEKQEKSEMLNVLSEEQKEKLRQILLGESPKEKKVTPPKDK